MLLLERGSGKKRGNSANHWGANGFLLAVVDVKIHLCPVIPIARWWSCPEDDQAANIARTVDAAWQALHSPSRRWNPYSSSMVRAEIRKRIEKAASGKLVPVD